MTLGVAESAAVDLYNRLIQLPYSEQEEIGHIEFRLRRLKRQRPGDLRVALALATAMGMAGKPLEAIETLEPVWQARHSLDYQMSITLIEDLTGLALYDRSKELVEGFFDQPSTPKSRLLINAAVRTGVGLGDADLLRKLVPHAGAPVERPLTRLDDAGMLDHFSGYQSLVRDIVYGHQSGMRFLLTSDDEDIDLTTYIFVKAPRAERKALEARIDDEAAAYCERHGLPFGFFVPTLTTIVLALEASPDTDVSL